MLFDEEFLSSFKEDPISGMMRFIDTVKKGWAQFESGPGWTAGEYEITLEAYAFIETVIDEKLVVLDRPDFVIEGDLAEECKKFYKYLNDLENIFNARASQKKLEILKNRFKVGLDATFAYEFSQGDLDRIQELISELRGQIAQSSHIEESHRRRLLKRLERLQSELHKKISDLDHFWGLIGDAGVALGKFGKDAKPIVERMQEIAQIVWRTQSRAEELPSGSSFPQIEHRKPSEDA